jgi:hypothetical protein
MPLYLHGGSPRTGTTSFQATVYAHRQGLAAAGILYPKVLSKGGNHHGGLVRLLKGADADGERGGFFAFLRSNRDADILISTELISSWLVEGKRQPFLRLLSDVDEVVPVTAIWTLRRADSLLVSSLLPQIWRGDLLEPPADFIRTRVHMLGDLTAGLLAMSERIGGRVVYSRYQPDGAHHESILRTVGVPDALRGQIMRRIREGPRMNLQPTQKAATVMMNLDAVAARTGIDVPRAAVYDGFARGALRFDDDVPCRLVGGELRQLAHEEALAVAADLGFAAYLDFFGHEQVPADPAHELDVADLTDGDIARLVSYLDRRDP